MNRVTVNRLAALLLLTAAFAPAAVLGALPVVAPVVVVLLGLAMAVAAFEPTPAPVTPEALSDAAPAGTPPTLT